MVAPVWLQSFNHCAYCPHQTLELTSSAYFQNKWKKKKRYRRTSVKWWHIQPPKFPVRAQKNHPLLASHPKKGLFMGRCLVPYLWSLLPSSWTQPEAPAVSVHYPTVLGAPFQTQRLTQRRLFQVPVRLEALECGEQEWSPLLSAGWIIAGPLNSWEYILSPRFKQDVNNSKNQL